MKTLRQIEDRILTVIMVVALMVPLIIVAISQSSTLPTLSFEGARIQVVDEKNGKTSLQLIFDVCISNVKMTTGAQFTLNFNPAYVTPSNYDNNVALDPRKRDVDPYAAFHQNPELYKEEKDGKLEAKNPFKTPEKDDEEISLSVAGGVGEIGLKFFTDGDNIVPSAGSGMRQVTVGEGRKENVFDASTSKLVLGSLSFRVVDPDKLPEIIRRFGGLEGVLLEGNYAKDVASIEKAKPGDKLIYFEGHADKKGGQPWGIGVVSGVGQPDAAGDYADYIENTINDYSGPPNNLPEAQATFTYQFARTVIGVEAVEPKFTVDAYQAYTDGTVSDLDIVLQKYSPAVLVKYSDGTQENVIFPWGRTSTVDDDGNVIVVDSAGNVISNLPWTATVAKDGNAGGNLVVKDEVTNATSEIRYDPTASRYKPKANQLYLMEKSFCYYEVDDTAHKYPKIFPLPVTVELTVTPITLVDVTATDLYRSYRLSNNLVEVNPHAERVQTVSELALPDVARLVTDVPAGGATLTLPIQGWSHRENYADGSIKYWPSAAAGMEIIHLWNDRATNETEGAYLHWPTNADGNKWETDDAAGGTVGANRAGKYTFQMAGGYGMEPVLGFTRAEIQAAYPWLTIPDSEKLGEDVEVPDGVNKEDIWPVGDAVRELLWEKDPNYGSHLDKSAYKVAWQSTTTDLATLPDLLLPDLTLRVHKEIGGNPQDLPDTTVFRLRLPDNTEVGVGTVTVQVAGDGGTPESKPTVVTEFDWFDPAAGDSGRYTQKQESFSFDGGDRKGYMLTLNPGDTAQEATGEYKTERDRLLRYINLGGWFYVSVNEDPTKYDWTEFIQVYVPPRENVHLEDKEYNFVGENAALYHFVNVGTAADPMIPNTVTLPAGSYATVDKTGQPAFRIEYEKDDDGKDTPVEKSRTRIVERYGVKTLYNGITGAQFGELNTFTIQPKAGSTTWEKTQLSGIKDGNGDPVTAYQFGANDFMDNHPAGKGTPGNGAPYGAYGWVRNLGRPAVTETGTGYQAPLYNATVRVEKDQLTVPEKPTDPDIPDEEEMREKIKLIYNGPLGGVTPYYDPETPVANRENVQLVAFDTKVEGYTVRQEYTLTIVNVGEVDIHGLAIDLLTDSLGAAYRTDGGGGHFVINRPPASFLPVGASTDFTLSYEYDLSGEAVNDAKYLEYLDKLYITSDSKHTVGDAAKEGVDYLLDFDAQFRVTKNGIHRVWVEYFPEDGSMGTAQVIIGGTDPILDGRAGSNSVVYGQTVYIIATPTDEYEVTDWGARISTGAILNDVTEVNGDVRLPDGRVVHVDGNSQIRVWSFVMQDYDVTFTVRFWEPISSKLRLSDLTTYADNQRSVLEGTEKPEYTVWQKRFTDDEYDEAKKATISGHLLSKDEQDMYLMQRGTAYKKGFDSSVSQYLVVIPYDADYSQVEATLRKVLNIDGNADLDNVAVVMDLFPEKIPTAGQSIFLESDRERQIYNRREVGNTAIPSVHTSDIFDSPTHGNSKYVRISLSHSGIVRYYYVEIHRPTQTPVATLKYGNSPYGMIMNADNIVDKDAAKAAFVANRYSFDGLKDDFVPAAVKGTDMEKVHYWTEAWVAVDALYEPESYRGYLYDPEKGTWSPDPDIYNEKEDNLDLNDYSFFAILGENVLDPGLETVLDSTGRPARKELALLALEVYTLDTEAQTQAERFALPVDPRDENLSEEDKLALAERTVMLYRHTPAGTLVTEWADLKTTDGAYIRPGRYRLIYIIPDYNYYDDYTGATIPNTWEPVEGKVLQVIRDFVVLSPVGDVNADMPVGEGGAANYIANAVDEEKVKDRITDPLGYMAEHYPDGAIFKFRTVDVNNDRNINNIDANTIRVKKHIERFYDPVNYK